MPKRARAWRSMWRRSAKNDVPLVEGVSEKSCHGIWDSPKCRSARAARCCTADQIGDLSFTERNGGKALLQSTACSLVAVPAGAPVTVTSRPVVGIAKLVEPGPMTKLAKLGEPVNGALPELPQAGATSKNTLSSTTLVNRFDSLTPFITLFQFVELGYFAPGRSTA